MLCVETIGKIRRRRLVKQDSISGIARDLGLSRNKVKKALRSGVEPFEYRAGRSTIDRDRASDHRRGRSVVEKWANLSPR